MCRLAAMVLVVVAMLSQPSRAAPPIPHFRVLYSTYLGRAGAYSVWCKVLSDDSPDTVEISAKFICRDRHGHMRVFIQDIGPAIRGSWEAQAHDFARLGRKQLYVSAKVRVAESRMLDCDGARINTLYGREDVMGQDAEYAQGKWFIDQWGREDNLRAYGGFGIFYNPTDQWKYESGLSAQEVEEERDDEKAIKHLEEDRRLHQPIPDED